MGGRKEYLQFLMVEMSYYWRLMYVGSIPIITPAVISKTDPGYYRYYQFWLEHILPVYGVAYMTMVHGFVSKRKMIYKPMLLLLALGIFSIPANLAYENFWYLWYFRCCKSILEKNRQTRNVARLRSYHKKQINEKRQCWQTLGAAGTGVFLYYSINERIIACRY